MLNWLGSIFGYVVQFLYGLIENYGVAIILFTILTRILMFPLTIKQQKTAAAQARLQPRMAEIKARYGNNQQAYNEALQELYAKENISPTAGCLPILIQFPLFIGMYRAISYPLTCVLHLEEKVVKALCDMYGVSTTASGMTSSAGYYEVNLLKAIRDGAPQVASASDVVTSGADVASTTDAIIATASDAVASASDIASLLGDKLDAVEKMADSFRFLGFDLLQTAGFWNLALVLALIVFVAQVGSMLLTNKVNGMTNTPGQGCSPNVMAYSMGIFSLVISFTVPAAFLLYWLVSSLLSPVQSWITKEYFGPVVINAKAEAQRNVTLKNNEQKIIDQVNATKGRIELKPELPKEKVGGEGIQAGSAKNRNKKKGNK
ncbi:MAG: YidC/Oxa1 family membrane protein insertase [Clostridia bacterium]|nr:YidC/Oxa1 family membrane protein insertase [Clostridia bacterium]